MASAKRKLYLEDVELLVQQMLADGELTSARLIAFAVRINGSEFKPKPQARKKSMTMKQAKEAVLSRFGCTSVAELRKNKTFTMGMTGEQYGLKTSEDWIRLYRRWVGVPESERDLNGPTCINGIDVLENFRPWHIFGLDPQNATAEDVKNSFRELVKTHHPDVGGDARVFERLQKMRDSVLALMN